MLVRCSWRCIHQQIIQISPIHVSQELLDKAILLGTSPDNCIVFIGQHESNRHNSQIVLYIYWLPSAVTLVNLLVYNAHDGRNGRSTDIDIHHTHLNILIAGKRKCELRSEARFTYASLSWQNENLMLHSREPLSNHSDIYKYDITLLDQSNRQQMLTRIWPFGSCSTYLLIGTSSTGICFTCLVVLRSLS